jgi:acyl carrier protein
MNSIEPIKKILIETLNLGARGQELTSESILLGGLAELDSMAVIHVITSLEEYFGFSIEDDEISAQVFETLGSLCAFVDSKLV